MQGSEKVPHAEDTRLDSDEYSLKLEECYHVAV